MLSGRPRPGQRAADRDVRRSRRPNIYANPVFLKSRKNLDTPRRRGYRFQDGAWEQGAPRASAAGARPHVMMSLLRLLLLQSLAVQSGALSTSPSLRGRPATRPSHPPSRLSSPVASESLAVTTSKACIGLAAQPVVWWSLATLKTSGCGLAGSTVQSIEGVAYLIVAAFALAGLTTRVRKGGAGLAAAELEAAEAEGSAFAAATAAAADAAKAAPADKRAAALRSLAVAEQRQRLSAEKVAAVPGPARLLGYAESLSYASAVAGLVVAASQLLEKGALPSALPVAGAACWS